MAPTGAKQTAAGQWSDRRQRLDRPASLPDSSHLPHRKLPANPARPLAYRRVRRRKLSSDAQPKVSSEAVAGSGTTAVAETLSKYAV